MYYNTGMKTYPWAGLVMIAIIIVATAYIAYSFGQRPNMEPVDIIAEEGTTADDNQNATAPTQKCPEVHIINKMPQITVDGEAPTENRYYILEGKSYQPNQLDEAWVKRNCNVPTEEVY